MSLFPAYSNDKTSEDSNNAFIDNHQESNKHPPSWLTNTSFKEFQNNVNKKHPIEISSDSESDGKKTHDRGSFPREKEHISISNDADHSNNYIEERDKIKRQNEKRNETKNQRR